MKTGYTYYTNDKNVWFKFEGTSGEITASSGVDREQMPSDVVDMLIIGRTPAYFITARIRVIDINDNSPTFPYPFFNVSLPESVPVGTSKVLPSATDADSAANGRILEYSLSGAQSSFRLVHSTSNGAGQPVLLQTTQPLDREVQQLYVLNVTARDGGTPPKYGQLTVFVNVQDTNDNSPAFTASHYNVTVPENLPEGSVITTVTASDLDAGANAELMYRIGSDRSNQFRIDSISGQLTSLVPKLDCPQASQCHGFTLARTDSDGCARVCILTVEAVDHGTPAQSGRAFVNVFIADENDHAPQVAFRPFPDGSTYASVSEDAKVGTILALVTVTDEDSDENGVADVRIQSGNEMELFELSQDGFFKLIKLKHSIQGLHEQSFSLTVKATDGGNPPKSSANSLTVYIRTADNRPLKFTQSEYSFAISADAPIHSFVGSISAGFESPSNLPDLPDVVYQFVSGNNDEYFQLSTKTGLITNTKSLIPLQSQSVSLKVSARKNGPGLETHLANVVITIKQANLHTPLFSQSQYNVSVLENKPIGSEIFRVSATDLDTGLEGQLRYEIDGENDDTSNFIIDAISGGIYLQQQLDREIEISYKVPVKVSDSGTVKRSGRTVVNVLVEDVNDNSPIFDRTEYHVNVLETDPIGSVVARVLAEDGDIGDNVSYFIQSGSIELFQLNSITGELLLRKSLEGVVGKGLSPLRVSIGAQDSAANVAANNATVNVYVLISDDKVPTFVDHQFHFTITEDNGLVGGATIGKAIGTASATDYDFDTADQIQYRITDGNRDEQFEIGHYSGELRNKKPIDREQTENFNLRVAAISRNGAAECNVQVNILDVNDNQPAFTSTAISNGTARVTLDANSPAGTLVFDASAFDPDHGDNGFVIYSLNPAQKFFIISKDGLIWQTSAAIPDKSSFTFSITATDKGEPPLSSNFQLTINTQAPEKQNELTTFYHSLTLPENIQVNSRVLQINLDHYFPVNETSSSVTYQTATVSETAPFDIFPDGWIFVKNWLDYEKTSSYRFKVIGESNGDRREVEINIKITDINDNRPKCDQKLFELAVSENQPLFTFVGSVSASDMDSGMNGMVVYRLLDQADKFQLNSISGSVTTLRVFDREATGEETEFTLRFRASDLGELSRFTDCNAVVRIVDENDNPPHFQLDVFAAEVSEDAQVDTVVAKVSATDQDSGENARLIYSLIAGNTDQVFKINDTSGEVILSKQLDREKIAEYRLTVMAKDSSSGPLLNSTSMLLIKVNDVNDNAPVFVSYLNSGINVSESAPIGTIIGVFTATDADTGIGSKVQYSVSSGNIDAAFEIDAQIGVLKLAKPLDFEITPAYTLTVQAADHGSPSLTKSVPVLINVLDQNDNAPQIETSLLKISENALLDERVAKLIVHDLDAGKNRESICTIERQFPSPVFRIDRNKEIFVKVQLDRESTDTYTLDIVCSDTPSNPKLALSTRKTITVVITDENDNSPRFFGPLAFAFDLTGVNVGYKVAQINAVDPDFDLNGKVGFYTESIEQSDGIFDVNFDGAIILKQPIKTITSVVYSLGVIAKDGGAVSRTTSAQLTLIPVPFDTGALKFERDLYKLEISEDAATGARLGSVGASGGERMRYYVTETQSANTPGKQLDQYVSVDVRSGELVVQKQVDRETIGPALLVRITAVDENADRPSAIHCLVSVCILVNR